MTSMCTPSAHDGNLVKIPVNNQSIEKFWMRIQLPPAQLKTVSDRTTA